MLQNGFSTYHYHNQSHHSKSCLRWSPIYTLCWSNCPSMKAKRTSNFFPIQRCMKSVFSYEWLSCFKQVTGNKSTDFFHKNGHVCKHYNQTIDTLRKPPTESNLVFQEISATNSYILFEHSYLKLSFCWIIKKNS